MLHSNLPAIVVCLGALLSAFGAVWLAINQSNDDRLLREKSEEIANLNKRIVSLVTGGDSYCYLYPLFATKGSYVHSFVLLHEGDSPLYEVNIRIFDVDHYDEMERNGNMIGAFEHATTKVSPGNMAPNSAITLKHLNFTATDYRRFNIFFSARNGFFSQPLRIKKVGDKWLVATVVKRQEGNKEEVIKEKIDDGFPKELLDDSWK